MDARALHTFFALNSLFDVFVGFKIGECRPFPPTYFEKTSFFQSRAFGQGKERFQKRKKK